MISIKNVLLVVLLAAVGFAQQIPTVVPKTVTISAGQTQQFTTNIEAPLWTASLGAAAAASAVESKLTNLPTL